MLHHYDTNFSQNQPHSYEQFLYDNGLHHERVKLMGLRGRNKKQLKISEAVLQRCFYEKVFWKYAANLQENTEITFRHGCSPVNLYIFRAIFLRTSLKGCFWKLSLLFFFSKFFFRIFKISVTHNFALQKMFYFFVYFLFWDCVSYRDHKNISFYKMLFPSKVFYHYKSLYFFTSYWMLTESKHEYVTYLHSS